MPFRELKTVIWGSHDSPLDELLPLWRFSVEHIEVRVAEPVTRSRKHWPAPTSSLRRLNLHRSTITDGAFADLLKLSPCLELLRYDHLCHVDCEWSSWWFVSRLTNSDPRKWHDGPRLTKALQKVQSTLRELDICVGVYSNVSEEVEFLDIRPVRGQLDPLQGFSRLCKLKAPIVMLLGWSPGELPLRLAEVVPAGLTHLGLTEDMAIQCTYEWTEELILEELEVFLSVWRKVTPNLQVVEVWLSREYGRWKNEEVVQLRVMCEEAGVSCKVHWHMESCCPQNTFPWVREDSQHRPWKATLPTIERIQHNKTARISELEHLLLPRETVNSQPGPPPFTQAELDAHIAGRIATPVPGRANTYRYTRTNNGKEMRVQVKRTRV
jgi:hypothetical protein